MDDMMVYPGTLMDDECGMRVIKCYIYKFAKERIERKQQYDVNLKRKTEKRFFLVSYGKTNMDSFPHH